jgi:hypothetical protein
MMYSTSGHQTPKCKRPRRCAEAFELKFRYSVQLVAILRNAFGCYCRQIGPLSRFRFYVSLLHVASPRFDGGILRSDDCHGQRLAPLWCRQCCVPDTFEGLNSPSTVPVRPTRPVAFDGCQLRCLGSVTPRHEFVDTVDFVIGDLGENPCEPGLGINVVELGGFDQGVGNGHGFAAPW